MTPLWVDAFCKKEVPFRFVALLVNLQGVEQRFYAVFLSVVMKTFCPLFEPMRLVPDAVFLSVVDPATKVRRTLSARLGVLVFHQRYGSPILLFRNAQTV